MFEVLKRAAGMSNNKVELSSLVDSKIPSREELSELGYTKVHMDMVYELYVQGLDYELLLNNNINCSISIIREAYNLLIQGFTVGVFRDLVKDNYIFLRNLLKYFSYQVENINPDMIKVDVLTCDEICKLSYYGDEFYKELPWILMNKDNAYSKLKSLSHCYERNVDFNDYRDILEHTDLVWDIITSNMSNKSGVASCKPMTASEIVRYNKMGYDLSPLALKIYEQSITRDLTLTDGKEIEATDRYGAHIVSVCYGFAAKGCSLMDYVNTEYLLSDILMHLTYGIDLDFLKMLNGLSYEQSDFVKTALIILKSRVAEFTAYEYSYKMKEVLEQHLEGKYFYEAVLRVFLSGEDVDTCINMNTEDDIVKMQSLCLLAGYDMSQCVQVKLDANQIYLVYLSSYYDVDLSSYIKTFDRFSQDGLALMTELASKTKYPFGRTYSVARSLEPTTFLQYSLVVRGEDPTISGGNLVIPMRFYR